MTSPINPRWSSDIGQANWLTERLDDFKGGKVASLVPSGFEAYARVLHPVETPERGRRLIRWAEIAKWSGVPLTGKSQWLEMALPEHVPESYRPWASQCPHIGSLYFNDARSLVATARQFTDTPEQCWCCIWHGYGTTRVPFVFPGEPTSPPLPPLIPVEVQDGAKVHTDYRDYFLYEESLDDSFMKAVEYLEGHSPNLWWPADRAWCVASEIDLNSTYVGGSAAFIDAIIKSADIEAFEVASADSVFEVMPEWMKLVAERASDQLVSLGMAEINTAIGDIRMELGRPSRIHRGYFRCVLVTDGMSSSGQIELSVKSDNELREEVVRMIQQELSSLASM